MKCKKCRKQIPDGSKFCNHCGTPQTGKQKLYRRKDGLYTKSITIDGKRVSFYGKSEKEIIQKIAAYKKGQEEKRRGEKFPEIADLWYDEHWETLSPTTQKGYKAPFEEIKKWFKNDYAQEITHKDINLYMKSLPKTYARKTCATRLGILNMIFKFAVVECYVSDNPCLYVSVPKGHSSKKRRAPTSTEINRIKSNIDLKYKGFPFGMLAVFLLYTGCRKGEALALTFRDIDKTSMRININKSVYFVSNEGRIKKPKTEAGIREIIIPKYLLPFLPKGRKSEYVFSPTPDKPMTDSFFTYGWRYWQKHTGLDLTAHQLRHGYATVLHEAGVDVKDAQELLGHADASTTQNIYTEVSHNQKITIEKKINSYLQ